MLYCRECSGVLDLLLLLLFRACFGVFTVVVFEFRAGVRVLWLFPSDSFIVGAL